MTVMLSTATIIIILGLTMCLISQSKEKRKLGALVIKVGLFLLALCAYLITRDYRLILLFTVIVITDFFLTLTLLSERIKGERS
jgi:hypothetical protein